MSNSVCIVRPQKKHSKELYELIIGNKKYLSKHLSWPKHVTSTTDVESFIYDANSQYELGKADIFLIFHKSILSGVVSFNELDTSNNIGTIGYWIGEQHQGQGIATLAVKEIMALGFTEYNLNKVVIRTDVNNKPSTFLAERLDFVKEGVARENELVNGNYVDHFIFSKLKREFLKMLD